MWLSGYPHPLSFSLITLKYLTFNIREQAVSITIAACQDLT
jgi:hypothetical protein